MKNLFQNITFLIILLVIFSCNKNFLTDEQSLLSTSSSIVISPEWESNDYTIFQQGYRNAKFTVSKAPEWLKIHSSSGQFTNSYAILNCKANTFSDFLEIGLYYTYMTLSVEGRGDLVIPVVYINEGNPAISADNSVKINYNKDFHFTFKNTGYGILFWNIIQHPDWLRLYNHNEWTSDNEVGGIIAPNETDGFYLKFNSDIAFTEYLPGKIIIASNDKNEPFIEVEVEIDFGNPVLNTSVGSNFLDFGQTETKRNFSISNRGDGLLIWKIDGCPEWLTVSENSGILQKNYSTSLIFTCNRELLSSGSNNTTIFLKTNDKNIPTYSISVTAVNNTRNSY